LELGLAQLLLGELVVVGHLLQLDLILRLLQAAGLQLLVEPHDRGIGGQGRHLVGGGRRHLAELLQEVGEAGPGVVVDERVGHG
jgi:hypothetical protein